MRNDETTNMPGGRDTVGHSGVQAWSAGELFPFILAFHEYYDGAGRFQGSRWVVSGPTIPHGVDFAGYAAAAKYAGFKRAQYDRIRAEQAGRDQVAASVFAAGCTAYYVDQDHQAMRPAALQGATMGAGEAPPKVDSGERMAMRPEYNEPPRDWQGVITWVVGHLPLASPERDAWARLWLLTKPLEDGVPALEAYTRFAVYLRDHGTWRTARAFRAEICAKLPVYDALRTVQVLQGLV